VYDLPSVASAGRELARNRQAHRLWFTDIWDEADGADLLIASGSAHYFKTPLPKMIASLHRPPPYVMLNRTPLYNGPTIATTQDGLIRIACMLYNCQEIIFAFQTSGYQLVDQWKAIEASLHSGLSGTIRSLLHGYVLP
jgi:putative methyltransferase (TIGR04325 family)